MHIEIRVYGRSKSPEGEDGCLVEQDKISSMTHDYIGDSVATDIGDRKSAKIGSPSVHFR